MYEIKRTLKRGVRYPDKELLYDYSGLSYTDLASTPAINAMRKNVVIELGDSGYWYQITFNPALTGTLGQKKIMEYFEVFAREIEAAVPRMTEEYRVFYQYFLDDKRKNGITFRIRNHNK